MAGNIINSYNLFVDSSTGRDANSKGDNYHLHLGNAGMTCEAGQYIRLTLNNFTMHKTFTDINANNCKFKVRTQVGTADGELTKRNNTTLNSIANDFGNNLAQAIIDAQGLGAATFALQNVKPSSVASVGGDSNHIISFDISFSANHNVASDGHVRVQFFSEDGETYEILGGDRIDDDTDTTTNSIATVTVADTTTLNVKCLYPAQRHTTSFVYLRATGIPNTSIESTSLAHPTENHRTDTTDSDILARIEADVEYINYNAQTGREYFMNVKQKQISNLTLRVTDARNRALGRALGSSSNTASGTGTAQSTLGNLSFSAVIRVDIVQQREIKELETRPTPQTTAARFDNLLIQPKFGKDGYGSGVER